MDKEQITFNDIPQILVDMYQKLEGLEQRLQSLDATLKALKGTSSAPSLHVPMTVDEVCDFLHMKKTTLYYNIRSGGMPAIRQGKHYTLFKDEVLKWMETRRRNPIPVQMKDSIAPHTGRKINYQEE